MSQQHWLAVDKKRDRRSFGHVDHMAMATLDLHGYTTVPAIKQLVEFLEKHCCQYDTSEHSECTTMVKVVTGMGSHSGNSGGPILKSHVNKFLTRHSFQFTFYTKGGYFIIPTIQNTGRLNYRSNSCELDSKIVTISRSSIDSDISSVLHTMRNIHPLQIQAQSPKSDDFSNKKTFAVNINEEMPTLQEVVRDESEFKRAVDASIHELRLHEKEIYKEQKIYQETLETSLVEAEQVEEKEKLLLLCAIQESIEYSEREHDEDAAALKEAIELSEHDCDQDETALKEALAASLVDASERCCFINNDEF